MVLVDTVITKLYCYITTTSHLYILKTATVGRTLGCCFIVLLLGDPKHGRTRAVVSFGDSCVFPKTPAKGVLVTCCLCTCRTLGRHEQKCAGLRRFSDSADTVDVLFAYQFWFTYTKSKRVHAPLAHVHAVVVVAVATKIGNPLLLAYRACHLPRLF